MHIFMFTLLGIALICLLVFICVCEHRAKLKNMLVTIERTFKYHNELNRTGVLERIRILPPLPAEMRPGPTRLLLTFPGHK